MPTRAITDAIDVDDHGRFAVVPPGVNLATFDRDSESPVDREMAEYVGHRIEAVTGRRVGLPAIVASSRLDPKKNIVGLVEAYASSPALQRAANLVLVTGSLDDPLVDASECHRHRAKRDPQGPRRHRRGRAWTEWWSPSASRARRNSPPPTATSPSTAAVFALTALYEPFGLAPLEAAAAGLAVVVTRNGGPSESLIDEDGEYGVLVDPADPPTSPPVLQRALGDEWGKLATAGRQRVHDRYTWDRTAEGYLAAVDESCAADRTRLASDRPVLPGRGAIPRYSTSRAGARRGSSRPGPSATRSCSIVSRSRTVTVRSSSVSKSTVTQNGVPISSWRR